PTHITDIYTLSLHDALPIYDHVVMMVFAHCSTSTARCRERFLLFPYSHRNGINRDMRIVVFAHMSFPKSRVLRWGAFHSCCSKRDRKSTRLNSSHLVISYAV